MIGKINFFKDAGYKRKVAAAAAFKSRLSIPAVGKSMVCASGASGGALGVRLEA